MIPGCYFMRLSPCVHTRPSPKNKKNPVNI